MASPRNKDVYVDVHENKDGDANASKDIRITKIPIYLDVKSLIDKIRRFLYNLFLLEVQPQ